MSLPCPYVEDYTKQELSLKDTLVAV